MDASGMIASESTPPADRFDPDHSTSIKEEVSMPRSAGAGLVARAPLLFLSHEELGAVNSTNEDGKTDMSRSADSAAAESAIISVDRYTRLAESRSVTPSPPPRPLARSQTNPNSLLASEDVSVDPGHSAMSQSMPVQGDDPVVDDDETPEATSLPDHVLSPSTPRSRFQDGKRRALRLLNVPPFNIITNRRGKLTLPFANTQNCIVVRRTLPYSTNVKFKKKRFLPITFSEEDVEFFASS